METRGQSLVKVYLGIFILNNMENNYYIYRHRRLDTFEVFYVGMGKTNNFKRAYIKYGRSSYWKNITNKIGYSVEILKINISWEEACELEIFLISEYGRKDLCLGNLVNMTDGGDGVKGAIQTDEHKKQISQKMTGRTLSEEHRKNLSITRKGIIFSKDTILKMSVAKEGTSHNKKSVIDTNTNIIYDTVNEAAKYFKVHPATLIRHLKGKVINKLPVEYYHGTKEEDL